MDYIDLYIVVMIIRGLESCHVSRNEEDSGWDNSKICSTVGYFGLYIAVMILMDSQSCHVSWNDEGSGGGESKIR